MRGAAACLVLWLVASVAAQLRREVVYLIRYGYMEGRDDTDPAKSKLDIEALMTRSGFLERMSKSIRDFQTFAGLNVTGEMDLETERLMENPRCGVKDLIGHGSYTRRKRYALQGGRWNVMDLTYRVTKYPSRNLNQRQVDQAVREAFAMWEAVTDLKFLASHKDSAHIEISFESFEHGDGAAFDGEGGALAHAHFPQYGGNVHIDDTEYWTVNSYKGTNLVQTLVHQFGHSLGLSHSDMRSAIMSPFFKAWDRDLHLDRDDVLAIQTLYGERTGGGAPGSMGAQESPPTKFVRDLCTDSKVDAIFKTTNNHTFVFQGDQYWEVSATGLVPGYPRRIVSDWPGLPGDIEAAFTLLETGFSYIFKGSQYWKFREYSDGRKELQAEYPKMISKGFPGIPESGLDAAFVWGGNNKIYFFQGNQYWKFDIEKTPNVRLDIYPKGIREWWGMESHMDAALQWENGRTYFFKSGRYWRFNDQRFAIDSGEPPFPRSAQDWLFDCSDANQLDVPPTRDQGLGVSREVFASRFTSGPRSTEGRWEFKEGSSVGDEVLDAAYFHDQDNVREWGRRPPNDLDAINDGGPRK